MSKPTKKRGIKKARGYKPNAPWDNYEIAGLEHIQGSDIVSGEAFDFWSDCRTFATAIGLTIKCEEGKFSSYCEGYNTPWLKAEGLTKEHVDKWAKELACDITERVLLAIENGDSYFFKDLARLCEQRPKAKNTESRLSHFRQWLILLHWCENPEKVGTGNRKQDRYFTASQIRKLAMEGKKPGEKGWFPQMESISDQTLRKNCKRLGIELLTKPRKG